MLHRLIFTSLALLLTPMLSTASDLDRAARKGDVNAIRQLVSAGADINQRASRGQTPLMLAVIERELQATETLIKLGADLDVRDSNGETALHHAITSADDSIVSLLLQSGAKVRIRDGSGRDAAQHALHLTALRGNANHKYQEISDIVSSAAVREGPGTEQKLPDSEGRRAYSDSYQNYDITPQAFYDAAYRALLKRGWKIEKHELTWLVGSRDKYGSHYKVQIRLIGDLVDVRYVPGYASDIKRSWLVSLGEDIKLTLRPLRKKAAVMVAPPEPSRSVPDAIPPPQ